MTSTIDRRSEYYRRTARSKSVQEQRPKEVAQTVWTIPNVLTFARIVMVPFFFWFFVNDVPSLREWNSFLAATTFMLASLTDWADGQLARMLGLVSQFGAFLDPVADKVMVATALVLLATSPPRPITVHAMALPVAIMISREITMSALREWAAASSEAAHKAVKVNSFGKWKTAFQMTAMTTLLYLRDPAEAFVRRLGLHDPGRRDAVVVVSFVVLWAAAVLSAWSFAIYFRGAWKHFFEPVAKRD